MEMLRDVQMSLFHNFYVFERENFNQFQSIKIVDTIFVEIRK